jgi:hypothetical protein
VDLPRTVRRSVGADPLAAGANAHRSARMRRIASPKRTLTASQATASVVPGLQTTPRPRAGETFLAFTRAMRLSLPAHSRPQVRDCLVLVVLGYMIPLGDGGAAASVEPSATTIRICAPASAGSPPASKVYSVLSELRIHVAAYVTAPKYLQRCDARWASARAGRPGASGNWRQGVEVIPAFARRWGASFNG